MQLIESKGSRLLRNRRVRLTVSDINQKEMVQAQAPCSSSCVHTCGRLVDEHARAAQRVVTALVRPETPFRSDDGTLRIGNGARAAKAGSSALLLLNKSVEPRATCGGVFNFAPAQVDLQQYYSTSAGTTAAHPSFKLARGEKRQLYVRTGKGRGHQAQPALHFVSGVSSQPCFSLPCAPSDTPSPSKNGCRVRGRTTGYAAFFEHYLAGARKEEDPAFLLSPFPSNLPTFP
jgi:hypothetical protein